MQERSKTEVRGILALVALLFGQVLLFSGSWVFGSLPAGMSEPGGEVFQMAGAALLLMKAGLLFGGAGWLFFGNGRWQRPVAMLFAAAVLSLMEIVVKGYLTNDFEQAVSLMAITVPIPFLFALITGGMLAYTSPLFQRAIASELPELPVDLPPGGDHIA